VARRIETGLAWLDDRTILVGTKGGLEAFRPLLPAADASTD
jgi:hypothetical protein